MFDFRYGAIAGFAHGGRLDGPGISNETMIQGLRDRRLINRLPLMLQHELADCIKPEDQAKVVLRIERHHKPDTYLDTNDVAAQCIECAVKNRYRTIYVLAYPILGWQFAWYLLWKEAHTRGIKVKILWSVWNIPSDPRSKQWWTRKWYGPPVYGAKRFLLGTRGK